jgi:DNA-binding NarL/FixJ family response regulator
MMKKKQIYIVDDQPLVRESLTVAINRQPDMAVCGESQSAETAMREMAAAEADLMVLDIALRESSGIQLIKQARAKLPGLAILVLTMLDEHYYAERCIRAGATGYVMKSESSKNIVAAIRDVLRGRMFVSPEIALAFTEKFVAGKFANGSWGVNTLSDRELEVFQLLGKGMTTRQVAERMRISIKTVEAFCRRIKLKLHVSNAAELLREAVRWNDHTVEQLAVNY